MNYSTVQGHPQTDETVSIISSFCFTSFDYCDVVWVPTMVSLSKPLECLHSRFLQQVPVSNSFIKLTEQCHFHTAVQVFRVLHHLCPEYLRNWFVYVKAHKGHGGRNKPCLFIPQINTSIGKNGFFYH